MDACGEDGDGGEIWVVTVDLVTMEMLMDGVGIITNLFR